MSWESVPEERGDDMDPKKPNTRIQLNRDAIRTLGWIILTSLIGIIGLSLWGITLRYGLFGSSEPETGGVADEALSILGNIAAAAVGGLVGWLTRDYAEQKEVGYQNIPADASVTPPPPTPAVPDIEPFNAADDVVDDPDEQEDAPDAPDHPDELDDEEDPDLTWDDEPKEKVK
jgi:hypothetical protein